MSDNLSADVRAAASAGMSYGQWKVLHPVTRRNEEPKKPKAEMPKLWRVCPICGKEFGVIKNTHRKYCSEECYHYANNQQTMERYHKRKERDNKNN